jgi:hypothetical protein
MAMTDTTIDFIARAQEMVGRPRWHLQRTGSG